MSRANPLARTRTPLLPPGARSRTALGLAVAAAEGAFRLQVCGACGAVQYPPREVCGRCLSDALAWREVARGGEVVAATTVRISADPYFRQRTPWRIGTVRMEAGPSVIAHLHEAAAVGGRVRLSLRLDAAGQGVMVAEPEGSRGEDRRLAAMGCDPRGRRVLVSDGRGAVGRAVARALADAGAEVLAGVAERWRPWASEGAGEAIELDVTDEDSVRRAVGAYGGRVEIVVNTGLPLRPGGVLGCADMTVPRAEMEVAYFGAMRLARAFGPALMARGADGALPACAWVDVLSVHALAGAPAFATASAAQAAALSLSRSLRAELRPGGIRVVELLVGPIDDPWHEALPPPKVAPAAIGAALVRALREGVERLAVGDVAQHLLAKWRDDPDLLGREPLGETT